MGQLRVAVAQDAPIWLDPARGAERVLHWIDEAAGQNAQIVAFGETFLPGYPFWLSETGGAKFDDAQQKQAYARYLESAVRVDGSEVAAIEARAKELGIFVILGMAERGPGPGTGTVYCSAMCIDPTRGRLPTHRKLVPTYEERLAWGQGDGHGLRAHAYAGTRVSTLNCWENWMPQARHAVYADGCEVHVALWPGAARLTRDITRFVAREGRVFCVSAGAVMRREDVPEDFVLRDALPEQEWFYDGGSAIAGPDGQWIVEPQARTIGLITADLDLHQIAAERQNFDPTGHYSRPDVFDVRVDRRRRAAAEFKDE